MGNTWQLELYCVTIRPDGHEGWGWETIYRGESLRQVIKIARRKKKETAGSAIRITWR